MNPAPAESNRRLQRAQRFGGRTRQKVRQRATFWRTTPAAILRDDSGILLILLSMGTAAAGDGDRSLHPPPPGHDLALGHRLSRPGGSAGVHRHGSRSRSGPAPAVVRLAGAAEADYSS